jgi:hypothetical protein
VQEQLAPAQGCSGSTSSIWGEEGTVQASQCGCQAVGGAFPKLRINSRLATLLPKKMAEIKSRKKKPFSFSANVLFAAAAACLPVQNKHSPFFQRRRRSGARPVWKTIIHVLLALSVYARPTSLQIPSLHRAHRNFLIFSFSAAHL